jgi:hypothetical protein
VALKTIKPFIYKGSGVNKLISGITNTEEPSLFGEDFSSVQVFIIIKFGDYY